MEKIIQSEAESHKLIFTDNDIRVIKSVESTVVIVTPPEGTVLSIPEQRQLISQPIETHLHIYDHIGGFTSLADTPSSYAGKRGKAVIVNEQENGLTFGLAPGGGGGVLEPGSVTNEYVADDAGIELSKLEDGEKLRELVEVSNYKISDMDDKGIVPLYYGFLAPGGKWYIMRENPFGVFRYIKGDINYESNWENRQLLVYNLYSVVFPL
jgi:hypothetical protein